MDDDPPDGGGGEKSPPDADMRTPEPLAYNKFHFKRPAEPLTSQTNKKNRQSPSELDSVFIVPGFENDNDYKYTSLDKAPFLVHVSRIEPDPSAGLSIRLMKIAQFLHKNQISGIVQGGIKPLGRNKIGVEFSTAHFANTFVDNPILSSNNYKALIPRFHVARMGVVRGVSVEDKLEDFVMGITPPVHCGRVVKARRLNVKKRNQDGSVTWVPSTTVVLTFLGQNQPEYIYYYSSTIPVAIYELPTIQCRKCCRFGHIMSQCRSKPRCYKCAQEHPGDSCNIAEEQRRSAVAERIRLREEWSALKGTNNDNNQKKVTKQRKVLMQKQSMADRVHAKRNGTKTTISDKTKSQTTQLASDALIGVVALVEVGSETRALALRAALSALGATVVPTWSPLVTHLVWAEGGSRTIRARARALACRLVSPLWVAACASEGRLLLEQAFPAAARPSDLPSPRTLRVLLKKAEAENIPLVDLLSDSKDESDSKQPRLRISSDTSLDKSTDKSTDTSLDKSTDTSADVETRVNTAPRRALPLSTSPTPAPKKSRRKLFTHKHDGADVTDDESDTENTKTAATKPTQKSKPLMMPQQRRELATAERIARRIIGGSGNTQRNVIRTEQFRIVLTGMSRTERSTIHHAARTLGARIQKQVNRKTTHVILGSCQNDDHTTGNITGVSNLLPHRSDLKVRTVNALVGAARGCRVLAARWIVDSEKEKKWLHHFGYEIKHLKKISQRARVERAALGRLRSEYAYDVFSGMRVRVTSNTDQRDAAILLLNLCGAVTVVGDRQDGADSDIDVTLGASDGQVSSKWVFDSVAAGRMRTTRRYVINSNSQIVASFTQN